MGLPFRDFRGKYTTECQNWQIKHPEILSPVLSKLETRVIVESDNVRELLHDPSRPLLWPIS